MKKRDHGDQRFFKNYFMKPHWIFGPIWAGNFECLRSGLNPSLNFYLWPGLHTTQHKFKWALEVHKFQFNLHKEGSNAPVLKISENACKTVESRSNTIVINTMRLNVSWHMAQEDYSGISTSLGPPFFVVWVKSQCASSYVKIASESLDLFHTFYDMRDRLLISNVFCLNMTSDCSNCCTSVFEVT